MLVRESNLAAFPGTLDPLFHGLSERPLLASVNPVNGAARLPAYGWKRQFTDPCAGSVPRLDLAESGMSLHGREET